jgi:hypothetical protein
MPCYWITFTFLFHLLMSYGQPVIPGHERFRGGIGFPSNLGNYIVTVEWCRFFRCVRWLRITVSQRSNNYPE